MVKGAIVYLLKNSSKDIKLIKQSLNLLDINFNINYKYPVIIFHEDLTEKSMQEIRKSSNSKIIFEQVHFEIPSYVDKNSVPEYLYADGYRYGIGCRHLGRFFSYDAYNHPIFKDYNYVWRLDADSFIMGKIDYDVFQYMEDNKYIFGYMVAILEHENFRKNFSETVSAYFKKDIQWDGKCYYGNFSISNLDFWRSKEYTNFYNYIDKGGWIYKYRWGEQMLHYIAVQMFLKESQIHKFDDIPYRHQAFTNKCSLPEPRLIDVIINKLIKLSAMIKQKLSI